MKIRRNDDNGTCLALSSARRSEAREARGEKKSPLLFVVHNIPWFAAEAGEKPAKPARRRHRRLRYSPEKYFREELEACPKGGTSERVKRDRDREGVITRRFFLASLSLSLHRFRSHSRRFYGDAARFLPSAVYFDVDRRGAALRRYGGERI